MDQQIRTKWLLKLAQSLRDKLDPETAKGMTKILDELSDDEFKNACSIIAKKYRSVPAPAVFFDIVRPNVDKREAIEAASRVIEAISLFGSNHFEEPKKHIGELGWEAVKRFGGWYQICTSRASTEVLFAQLRDICQTLLERKKDGLSDIAPCFKIEDTQKLKIEILRNSNNAPLSIEDKQDLIFNDEEKGNYEKQF